MKKIAVIAVAALLAAGCTLVKQTHRSSNPYSNPFYQRFLNPAVPIDASIQRDIIILRTNPNSAPTHNDLGQLLIQKGFPKDAEREFERSVDADRRFWPAWYNLGVSYVSPAVRLLVHSVLVWFLCAILSVRHCVGGARVARGGHHSLRD